MSKYHLSPPAPPGYLYNHYLEERRKIMLEFNAPAPTPVTPTNRNNVAIVMDRSSSMQNKRKGAVDSINLQLRSLREESARTGIQTLVSILTFSDEVQVDLLSKNVNEIGELNANSYSPHGNTALRCGIWDAINILQTNGGPKQVIVITDGEENASYRVSSNSLITKIQSLASSNMWTFAACVPPGHKGYLTQLGFPIGNVMEWEQTEAGMRVMTQSVVAANTTRYKDITRRVTMTSSYFAPDVNVSPTVVQTNLDDLSNKFTVFSVSNKEPIAPFVARNTGRPYTMGKSFYQLTKPEKVQAHKNVVIRDKFGKIYGGDNARSILRIPAGGEIKLNPATNNDYEVYISSTSHNRNLMPNTNVLVQK
jgi:hypothetical protein